MVNKKNAQNEFELYESMQLWLKDYLVDKYKNCEIITVGSYLKK